MARVILDHGFAVVDNRRPRGLTPETKGSRLRARGRRLSRMARTWHDELRSRGYRVTPQRQFVLEAINKLEHATPEDICADVRQTASGVNISTVYRTLELLEQLGLVTHTHLGHGAPTYHLATQADHVHLVCRDCGKVTQVSPQTVRGLVSALDREHGFETDVGHLTVFGRCGGCRARGASADAATG